MNLLSDPVTGEMISKSELKRRQKQRQKDAEKAEKAAKAQSEGGAGGAGGTPKAGANMAVSYTHLTLPTICSV